MSKIRQSPAYLLQPPLHGLLLAFRHEFRQHRRLVAADKFLELQRARDLRRIIVCVVEGQRRVEATILAALPDFVVLVQNFPRRIDELPARRLFQFQSGLQIKRPHHLARLAGHSHRRRGDQKQRNRSMASHDESPGWA